jgi:hypothetical protein
VQTKIRPCREDIILKKASLFGTLKYYLRVGVGCSWRVGSGVVVGGWVISCLLRTTYFAFLDIFRLFSCFSLQLLQCDITFPIFFLSSVYIVWKINRLHASKICLHIIWIFAKPLPTRLLKPNLRKDLIFPITYSPYKFYQ